jgi:hypothetical protein
MPTKSRTHPANRPPATNTSSAPVKVPPGPAKEAFPLALALAVVALVVAVLAFAWTAFGGSGGSSDCQARAWDSVPEERALPSGWAVSTTSFFVGNMTVTLEGPAADQETGEGVIYTTVTCYGQDGAEALARSRVADTAAGSATTDLDGIGEEGYAIGDDGSGLSAIHFRRGDLVAYLVVAGNVSSDELRATARAFDQAMIDARAGDVPTLAPAGTPGAAPESPGTELTAPPEEPIASATPDASPASPELEGMLPTEIDGTPFIVETFTGADAFGNDAGSRAVTAGLRALGKTPADLELAEVYDENQAIDLYMFAFRLAGADPEALRTLVLDSWLVAGAEGVTTEEVELAGKSMTHVEYGDEFPDAYLYSTGDVAILIHTGSEELAEAAAATLP